MLLCIFRSGRGCLGFVWFHHSVSLLSVLVFNFVTIFRFFEIGQGYNLFSRDQTRFIFALPGSVHPTESLLCETGSLPPKNLRSNKFCPDKLCLFRFWVEGKKQRKKGQKSVLALVRLIWREETGDTTKPNPPTLKIHTPHNPALLH